MNQHPDSAVSAADPSDRAVAPDAVSGKPLKIALLGCGVVGTQVARLLTHKPEDLEARIGRPVELVGIAVRDLTRPRDDLDPALFTDDALGLVSRDDLDVVVEVIGGLDPVGALIRAAIEHGASVVTANKALLAAEGPELYAAAEKAGVDLHFEAAVAGAIPIVRPLRESLVGDQITEVLGIVNGTTNYILDKMSSEGMTFADALAQAQELGYAEADPTADIEGFDAAAKAAILASLAFHTQVRGEEVFREGITELQLGDIQAAQKMGFEVKLVAMAELNEDDSVSVHVHPAMIPQSHPLASVSGAYNAIFVESREAGRLMFLGPGAGGAPTASAVMGDLVTVARNRVRGVASPSQSNYTQRKVAPMGQTRCRYFLRFDVKDRPGVLAAAAQIFADRGVSVQTVQQSTVDALARIDGLSATLGMFTHEATEDVMQQCVARLEASDFVPGSVRVLRVEGV